MPLELGPYARGTMSPAISSVLTIVGGVFDDFDLDARITHIRDGKHSEGSLHYDGDAIDVVWIPYDTLPKSLAEEILEELYRRLNGWTKSAGLVGDYDVVYESTHFHIEHQPKLDDVAYRQQVSKYLYGE